MARPRILNPEPAEPSVEAVALSREILAETKATGAPEQCAPLDRLTAQLHGISPERIEGDRPRIAFWVNLYNALVLHCLCLKPIHGSLLRHLRLFDKIAYRVGDRAYPLNLIEHGLLRRNRRQPYRLRRPMRDSDPRLASAPSALDPRIHFALNCGARSCPPIRSYDPEALDDQLELATRAYLEAEATVDAEACRVKLPRLMRLYKADFGTREEQSNFAARYLPVLRDCRELRGRALRIGYGRFDWTVASRPSA
jgi:hypothetical protein